jgi:hypothetical protein
VAHAERASLTAWDGNYIREAHVVEKQAAGMSLLNADSVIEV